MGRKHNSLLLTALEEAILNSVYNKSRYGLEIIEMISEVTEGRCQVGFGSIYPELKKLKDKGFLKSMQVQDFPEKRGDHLRNYYALTTLGLAVLNDAESLRKNLRDWEPKTDN